MTNEDFVLWQATAAAQRRLGLPIDPPPTMDSNSRRNMLKPAKTTGHLDVMGRYAAFSDQGIERLFASLDSDEALTKSDVAKAHMILMRIAHRLPMNETLSSATSTTLADSLGLERSVLAKILPALVRAGVIKIDTRRRPAPIYVNPAIVWRGDGGKIVEASKSYEALDFTP